MADAVSPDISGGKFSRRDFLKLGGFVIGTAGVVAIAPKAVDAFQNASAEIKTGVNWKEDPYSKIDFVNRPEILVDNPSSEERITKDLTGLSETVDQYLKRMAVKYKDPKMAIDLEGYKANTLGLMQETVKLAGVLVDTKERNLLNVIPEIEKKYLEYATYLHSVLMLDEAHKNDTREEFDKVFENLPYAEALANVLDKSNPLVDEVATGVRRSEIMSHWAYQWKELIKNESVSNPLFGHYFGYADETGLGGQGTDFITTPNFAQQYLSRTPLNQIEKEEVDGKLRPKEVVFINIDPEVQKILFERMKSFGLERAVGRIGVDPQIFAAVAYSYSVSGDVLLGAPLNIETYTKYTRLIDDLFYHETFHILEGRANGDGGTGLPEADYLEFRNLQLELIKRFDPLADMQKLFNPKGEYIDFGKYADLLEAINDSELNLNEMTLADYYFQTLEDLHGQDQSGRNIGKFTNDLRVGMQQISGVDLDKYFSIQSGDATLENIFTSLESQLPTMDGLSALVAKTIIDNKKDISIRKRSTFNDEKTESEYFIKKVLPYTLMHLGMYKVEELKKSCEGVNNSQLAKSFLGYWQQELDRFVRGALPTREFTADLFSHSLIDDGKNIEWGDAKEISMQMVELLKRNGLALQSKAEVV